jgi:MFS family permease
MSTESSSKSPLREIVQPFIDLVHAPRALWGINLSYLIEGMVYFGMLGYLAMHFTNFVFAGVRDADVYSHPMVGFLTGGITLAMFFLGVVPDRWGVRRALIAAFALLFVGRVVISAAPGLGLQPGLWGPLHWATMGGLLLVILGYGMYQPAAYAGVRQFTNPRTAAMGYAMLYALMNLGGWLPTFAFLLRDDDYAGLGIIGTYWVYASFTLVALILTAIILSKKTVEHAKARAKEETERIKAEEAATKTAADQREEAAAAAVTARRERVPAHLWFLWAVLTAACFIIAWSRRSVPDAGPWTGAGWLIGGILLLVAGLLLFIRPIRIWFANHPLGDAKFAYFIFALIPVQTLFTYNWLVLPQYINRAYTGWIGEYFEVFANFNPILIFIAVPIVTAMTQKAKVYNMMIYGTFIMAAPAFLLAIEASPVTLVSYILIMTVGEAMWQPRFLQYAAEIAPEGRTGIYMGVAQFPWFMTKILVPFYSGFMLARYCPPEGQQNTEFMWLIFAIIAMTSTVMLVLAKGWLGKDFKTKAD